MLATIAFEAIILKTNLNEKQIYLLYYPLKIRAFLYLAIFTLKKISNPLFDKTKAQLQVV